LLKGPRPLGNFGKISKRTLVKMGKFLRKNKNNNVIPKMEELNLSWKKRSFKKKLIPRIRYPPSRPNNIN